MPLVRISGSEGEGEGVTGTTGSRSGVGGTVGSGELGRVTTNLTLADHVGKFVAGEVASQFKNENLADVLKGKNAIMISGSWG
jgi:hypothetical protein